MTCCVSKPYQSTVVGKCVTKPPKDADGRSKWVCGGDDGTTTLARTCDEAADCPKGELCTIEPYDEA